MMRRFTAILVCVLACWRGADGAGNPSADALVEGRELLRGKAALDDGLYQVAEEQFRAFLKRESQSGVGNEEALDLLAQALERQGKFKDISELMRVRRRWLLAREDTGAFAFWRALAQLRTGNPAQALAEVEQFETRFPDDAYFCRVLLLRASACLELKRAPDALAYYERFDAHCADAPDRAAHAIEWGRALVREGRAAEAESILRRLETIDAPPSLRLEGRFWLGKALLDAGDALRARDVFTSVYGATAADPDLRARGAYALAGILEAAGEHAAALEAMTNGVATAADADLRTEGAWRVGRLKLRIGQTDDGVTLLRALIARHHGSPEAGMAQVALASALLDAGRADEAVTEFQHYLETFDDPAGQAAAHEGKGWGLLALSRPAEAVLAFVHAAALHETPASVETCLFKVGDAYFENGQFRMAFDAYARLIETFPSGRRMYDARMQQGVCLAKLGEHRLAAEAFAELANHAAGTPVADEALVRAASALEAGEDAAAAVDAYTRAIDRIAGGTLRARAIQGRGLLLYRAFEFEKAAADFERVLAEFPDEKLAEQAFYMRGMCLYGMMRDREAVDSCRAFLEKYPDSRWLADVLFWLGKYEHNRGRFEESERLFSEIALRRPTEPLAADALLWAGVSASRRKEYVRSIEHFSRLVKEYPSSPCVPEARFYQGDAMSELGLFSEAILVFDEIVSRFPDSHLAAAAWGRKGDCQFTLGANDAKRYEESMASYRMVADDPSARPDLVLQANYKIGRCLEKTGRANEALEQYYVAVILRYNEDREKGVWHDQLSRIWFTRAVFSAADLLEARKDWRGMVGVLERVAATGGAAAGEAQARIERVKAEQWRYFR